MNRKTVLLYLLISVIVIAAICATQMNSVHSFDNQCNLCHLGEKNWKLLTKKPDTLCLSCHQDQKSRTHPSDMYPVKQIPDMFPLFKGKISCVSCHFPHPDYSDNPTQPENPYFLRFRTTGKAFCFQCHQGDFTGSSTDMHAISVQKAHLVNSKDELRSILDDNSRDCLSCHDGTLAKGAEVSTGGASFNHNIGVSHPIGVDYNEIARRNPREYTNPSMLDERIRLFDGKIGCETCHDHYSNIKKRLVMDNFRSRLCLSCHDM